MRLPARARTVATVLATSTLALSASGAQAGSMDHGAHAAPTAHAAHAATVANAAHAATAGAPAHAGRASHTSPRGAAHDAMFEVGTAQSPLVTRPGKGPLWPGSKVNAVGMTSHGTLAEAVLADRLAARRLATGSAPAALTTAQATKKLSASCRKALKARGGSLTKAAKKRRSRCLAQRRKLIEDSRRAPSTTPGVSAPAAPVKGPDPTTAPPAAGPADPGTGAPAPAPTPTPAPGTTSPAPDTPADPAGPVYGAVGVTATEGGERFRLTRGYVSADIVNFELVNVDSQKHDLYIAPADASGEINGPAKEIIGRTNGQVDGRPTRASTDMVLRPGRYKLICTVAGHGPMAVDFTVYAPGA